MSLHNTHVQRLTQPQLLWTGVKNDKENVKLYM